ncbi:MAG: hypothetical protein GXO89_01380 [Chlorobi bacterium]|nr:hypothetical protein [Chlorobiota bacterium]
MRISRYLKYVVFIFFGFLILNSGCRKKSPSPSWNVELLAPLFVDTIGVYDVFNDSLIVENPDQLLSFVFNEKLYEINVDSLVKLPDTLFNFAYSMDWLPFPIPLAPGDLIISDTFDWPLDYETFGFEGIALEEAYVRSGFIHFEVFNKSDGPILSQFRINSAIKNVSDTFNVSKTVESGQIASEAFDFSGYRLNLRGSNNDTVNMLNYYIGLFADPGIPDTLLLTSVDSFSVNIYFEDLVMDYAKGNFGKNDFHFGPEISHLGFFNNLNIGGISMKDAKVKLQIHNTYGVDGNMKIDQITAINSSTGEVLGLEGDILDSLLYIPGGTQTGNGLGNIQPSINDFDFSETNFNDLLQIIPDQISYTLDMTTNPFEDSITREHFFYYDYPIEVYLDMEVSQGIMLQDLFGWGRSEWNGENIDLENVLNGNLVLKYTNWFPFTFDMDLYLEDENMEVMDTLFYEGVIEGGLPNADGRVLQPTVSRIQVELTGSLRKSVKDAKFAYFQIYINSVEGGHVKVYSDYVMEFKMIGDFEWIMEP